MLTLCESRITQDAASLAKRAQPCMHIMSKNVNSQQEPCKTPCICSEGKALDAKLACCHESLFLGTLQHIDDCTEEVSLPLA